MKCHETAKLPASHAASAWATAAHATGSRQGRHPAPGGPADRRLRQVPLRLGGHPAGHAPLLPRASCRACHAGAAGCVPHPRRPRGPLRAVPRRPDAGPRHAGVPPDLRGKRCLFCHDGQGEAGSSSRRAQVCPRSRSPRSRTPSRARSRTACTATASGASPRCRRATRPFEQETCLWCHVPSVPGTTTVIPAY